MKVTSDREDFRPYKLIMEIESKRESEVVHALFNLTFVTDFLEKNGVPTKAVRRVADENSHNFNAEVTEEFINFISHHPAFLALGEKNNRTK